MPIPKFDEWKPEASAPPKFDDWQPPAQASAQDLGYDPEILRMTPAQRRQRQAAYRQSLIDHPEKRAADLAATKKATGFEEPQAPEGSVLDRFVSGAKNAIVGPVKEAYTYVTNPAEWVRQHSQGGVGISPSLPGESQVAQATSGDVAGAVGGVAGLAGTVGALYGLSKAAGPVRDAFKVNPQNAIPKVFPGADKTLGVVAPEAMADLKAYGPAAPKSPILGRAQMQAENLVPTKMSGLPESHLRTAISTMQEQGLEPWMQRARSAGVMVSGDVIVLGTRDAIPVTEWIENPDSAAAQVQAAQKAYGGKQFTVDQMRDILADKNKASSPIYNKSTAAQGTAQVNTTSPAIAQAQGAGARNALYKVLDPENGGVGPAEIQRRTGNLYKLGSAAEDSYGSIRAEKPNSIAGGIVQPLSNAASALARGSPTQFFKNLGHPFAGASDATISDLFRQAPDAAPLPKPASARYPTAAGSVSQTGLPPAWQQNQWQGIGSPKQLEAGAQPFTGGPITIGNELLRDSPGIEMPDASGGASKPASSYVARDPKTGRMKKYYLSQ